MYPFEVSLHLLYKMVIKLDILQCNENISDVLGSQTWRRWRVAWIQGTYYDLFCFALFCSYMNANNLAK